MKHIVKILPAVAILITLTLPQQAAAKDVCFVDYKAKQQSTGGGLQLHYGVIRLQGAACSNRRVLETAIAARISEGNWTLLTLLTKFDKSGLKQRRKNAGKYFLRY